MDPIDERAERATSGSEGGRRPTERIDERAERAKSGSEGGRRPTERIDLRDHALWATKVLKPERAAAFRRDDARNLLRRTLTAFVARYELTVYAWSVEPSRVHLVMRVPLDRLVNDALGDLFGYYTRRFNVRYGKRGPVFRSKFLKRVVVGPLAITDAIRRTHRVPITRNIEMKPGDEPWSSQRCYEGGPADGVVTLYTPSGTAMRRPPMHLDA